MWDMYEAQSLLIVKPRWTFLWLTRRYILLMPAWGSGAKITFSDMPKTDCLPSPEAALAPDNRSARPSRNFFVEPRDKDRWKENHYEMFGCQVLSSLCLARASHTHAVRRGILHKVLPGCGENSMARYDCQET
jgi:hypothetical protein